MQKNNNNKKSRKIVIRSEADAYNILALAAKGEVGPYSTIEFSGWPTLTLYLKGKKFEQSITPTVMKGLLELQRGVYRSYASARFDFPQKRLTEDEKDSLEIKVSVKGGSSKFEINFQDIATKLIEELVPVMDPNNVLITVVTIAVMYFGTSAYRSYLENRKEIRAKEISDETQRLALESMKFATEQETKRTQIIAELAKKDRRIDNIERLAYDTHTEIIKSLSSSTEAKLGGIVIEPNVSDFLTQNARRRSHEIRLDGEYRLLKLDWSNSDRFKVKVFNINTRQQLDAEVQDNSLSGSTKEALKNAEWSRKSVLLEINAKLFGEEDFRDAVILSAKLKDEKK